MSEVSGTLIFHVIKKLHLGYVHIVDSLLPETAGVVESVEDIECEMDKVGEVEGEESELEIDECG